MITLEQALDAMSHKRIAGLKTTAMDDNDVLNLILQRSEIIRDQPDYNSYVKKWMRGNPAPMLRLINAMGRDELIRRAAAFIYLEYEEIRAVFDADPPKHLVDIGCGYALFDLFAALDTGSTITLIDLEENENRHFGFKEEGAAYSNLDVAAKFLQDNGVDADKITTVNPAKAKVTDLADVDMAVSFISCGYHYPWDTYETFFKDTVIPGGRIILDIRSHKMDEARPGLSKIGTLQMLQKAANNSANRVMITKPGRA